MAHLLTPGGVQVMLGPNQDIQPPVTVQVIHVKMITSPSGDRYRVVLSDGQQFVQGMLSTQLNHIAADGKLVNHNLIRIDNFMTNNVSGKTIVILLGLEVLPDRLNERIGSPVDCSAGAAQPTAAPVTSAQPLYNSTNNAYGGGTAALASPYNQKARVNNPIHPGNAPMTMSPPTSSHIKNSYSRPSFGVSGSSTGGGAPIERSSSTSSLYTSISDLNLYQSRWTIQAKVSAKSDVKTWSNAKGEGSLFSVDLLDASGVDIRATFFKEAVDRFHTMLQVGQVYTFSGGRLKVANARWNDCKSQYEITFDQNSEIHLCANASVDNAPYDFVENIASLENIPVEEEKQTSVDVLALVQSVGDVSTIISKKQGKEYNKCDVTLVDDSEAQVALTLWNEQAHKAHSMCPVGEIVAIRRARLSAYGGGKSLSGPREVTRALQIPNSALLPAFRRLQEWHHRTGGQVSAARSLSRSGGAMGGPASLSERQVIADIKREQLGYQNHDKGDYISVCATLTFLKKDKDGGAWYPACPNDKEPCLSRCKVTPTAAGGPEESWSCERCLGTYPNCVRRWIFSGVMEDSSGSTWVTFFDDAAHSLFGGVTADEVYQKSDGSVPSDFYDSTFAEAVYSEWIIKARCKLEPGQDGGDARVKASVQSIHPIDYVRESKDLLAAISHF